MKYLTEKEVRFIEALKKDLEINGEKSFVEILFKTSFEDSEKLKKDLHDMFDDYYLSLFADSDLLFESVDSCYIGKYKDTFWGTGSEGEVFGVGKEIQNLAFIIIDAYYGDVLDYESKEEVSKYFKNHLNLDYDEYIQSYRDFCSSLGYEYKEDLDLIEKQSEDFEKELQLLE